jgi:tRNA modification GTPase
VIAVLSKSDLPAVTTAGDVRALIGPVPTVEVSSVAGTGLADLVAELARSLLQTADRHDDEEVMLFRERHREAALRAANALERADSALASSAPLELVACDLAVATDALAEITGLVTSEDVLDRVFAEFCLGK